MIQIIDAVLETDNRFIYSRNEEFNMARKKFETLTEQMFYILLSLEEEYCGIDIMDKIQNMTEGRISVGSGTLYTILGEFEKNNLIRETAVEGRKRSYIITQEGQKILSNEISRLTQQLEDYKKFGRENSIE